MSLTPSETGLSADSHHALSFPDNQTFELKLEVVPNFAQDSIYAGDADDVLSPYFTTLLDPATGYVYIARAMVDGTQPKVQIVRHDPALGTSSIVAAANITLLGGTSFNLKDLISLSLVMNGSETRVYYATNDGLYWLQSDGASGTVFASNTITVNAISETDISSLATVTTGPGDTLSIPTSRLHDDDASTYWRSDNVTGRLDYDFGTAKNVAALTLSAWDWDNTKSVKFAKRMPKKFKVLYSSDGSNWTNAATFIDQLDWKRGETRTFILPEAISARYWRINFVENNGSKNRINIGEVEFFEKVNVSKRKIVHVSAAAWNRIYTLDWTTDNLYQMRYHTTADGTVWNTQTTVFTWHNNVQDFCAVDPGSFDPDHFFLLTDIAPLNKTIGESGYTRNIMLRRQAIIGFKTLDFSTPHFTVDFIEECKPYRRIDSIGVIYNDDYFELTAYRRDGLLESDLVANRRYRSKDAENWTRGELVNVTPDWSDYAAPHNAYDFPHALKPAGIYNGKIYYATAGAVYSRGYSSWEGNESPTLVDISSYVIGYNLQNAGGLAANVELQGYELPADSQFILHHYFGNWHPVHGTRTVKIGTTLAESVQEIVAYNDLTFSIASRDRIAMFDTVVASEQPYAWQTQVLGGDSYTDSTETGYGGLSHSAHQKGEWKTLGNRLVLNQENKVGIVFNTLSQYVDNGTATTVMYIPTADAEAGIVFRAVDVNNFYAVVLNFTSATTADLELRLYREGTAGYIVIASAPLTSLATNRSYHMQVTFRYSSVEAGILDVTDSYEDNGDLRIYHVGDAPVQLSAQINRDYEYPSPSYWETGVYEYELANSMPRTGYTGLIGKGVFLDDDTGE